MLLNTENNGLNTATYTDDKITYSFTNQCRIYYSEVPVFAQNAILTMKH